MVGKYLDELQMVYLGGQNEEYIHQGTVEAQEIQMLIAVEVDMGYWYCMQDSCFCYPRCCFVEGSHYGRHDFVGDSHCCCWVGNLETRLMT